MSTYDITGPGPAIKIDVEAHEKEQRRTSLEARRKWLAAESEKIEAALREEG